MTPTEIVEGHSVALVGNSQKILKEKPGRLIDNHDVVIRINRGLPKFFDAESIGSRTTIWATAKYWKDCAPPSDCSATLWMKLTPLGQQHLKLMQSVVKPDELFGWTTDLETECREFVGADPGTGIRLLWWLKTKTRARSVSCYGMDCWEAPSHWSGRKNTPNHSPDLERAAMLKLL